MGWLSGIWSDIYTSDKPGNRRLKVEESSTAFEDGRVFRSYHELDIANNETQVFKFTLTGDVVLLSSNIDLDDGGIRYEVYNSDPIESGVFEPIPSYQTNLASGASLNISNVVISTGGEVDVTGLTPNDVTRVLSANANSKQSTVGVIDGDERGFPATTAYVVVSVLDGVSGGAKGTIKWLWYNKA